MRHLFLTSRSSYRDFGARSRCLMYAYVITSYSEMWDIIGYTWKSSYVDISSFLPLKWHKLSQFITVKYYHILNLWIHMMTVDGQLIVTAKSIAMVTTHIFHNILLRHEGYVNTSLIYDSSTRQTKYHAIIRYVLSQYIFMQLNLW